MSVRELGQKIVELVESFAEWGVEGIALFVRFDWLDLSILQAIVLVSVIVWYLFSRAEQDADYIQAVGSTMKHGDKEEQSLYADDIEYLRRVEKSGFQFYFYKGLKLIGLWALAWFIGYGLTEYNADRGVQWMIIVTILYCLRLNAFKSDVRETLKMNDLREYPKL